MKKILFLLSLFIIPFVGSIADESTLTVGLTSNYIFRGLTQTEDKAAVQVNYQLSEIKNTGFYVGAFASNVAKGAEVDIFGGWKLAFGKDDAFILDLGAIEYLYTDDNFAPISHDLYAGVQYKKTYLKYYLGEEEALYLDIGTGFNIVGDIELLLHFGEVFATAQNGNDASVTLQKYFGSTKVGLAATYEDKTSNKKMKAFAFIYKEF